MTDEYSYRDARLSIWQAAVGEIKHTRPAQTGARFAAADLKDSPSYDNLMKPVHSVANFVKAAGKPFELLAHEVKIGILDIKAKFDPLEDCAQAAAHFLWAELEGNQKNSALYESELRKAVCDAAGWTECLTTYLGYKALLQKPVYRPNQNMVVDLRASKKLAIIADWGTGEPAAVNLLKEVAALKPDVLLHLGDVYYAGTKTEATNNFLTHCQTILGGIPLYSLCGNHDMYSGGEGYYWLLDQIGQKSSYFCLQNDHWQFLAMDTGFHDNNPFNISTNMTQLVSQDGWSEASWHLDQVKRAGQRKVVLLSHHQLFSPFASVGSVDGQAYAYNPNLYQVFAPILPKVEWWFWGHEHTLAVFDPYMGLKRGRCVGASAVPVFQDQQSYTVASNLKTLDDGALPNWNPKAVLGFTGDLYNNCFAMMTLNGPSATVEYYEVPLLQPARKFDVVDTVS